QLAPILAAPQDFLAILPHGAGPKYYKEHPHANREVMKFLDTLDLDTEGIDVALPMPQRTPKREFEGPWPMIMTGASAELKDFLLWYQTFSVNTKLTFHVTTFDPTTVCWVVMTISGDAVRNDAVTKARVLGTVKRRLWNDTGFVNFVNRVSGAAGVAGSARQRVVEATKSFDLVYVETEKSEGAHAPVYQLTAKPISNDPATHRQWIALIRGLKGGYVVGMHVLLINKHFVDCIWCKGRLHPAHNCPFHQTEGWLGIKPDGAERHKQRVDRDDNDGGHRVGGRGRGRGHGRGQGNGGHNDDREGWTRASSGSGRGRGKYNHNRYEMYE
ncbi:hypothetical protein DFH09DRAFT_943064, partial [Mycena vulgaris]